MKDYIWKNDYLNISCSMEWKFIRRIRTFVDDFIDFTIDTGNLSKRVSMAANELLENAIKYSISPEIYLELSLKTEYLEKDHVKLTVSNLGKEKHICLLKEVFKEINTGDPVKAYLKRMESVFNDSVDNDSTHLGLARIRCEGYADLHLEISEENRVTISAYMPY